MEVPGIEIPALLVGSLRTVLKPAQIRHFISCRFWILPLFMGTISNISPQIVPTGDYEKSWEGLLIFKQPHPVYLSGLHTPITRERGVKLITATGLPAFIPPVEQGGVSRICQRRTSGYSIYGWRAIRRRRSQRQRGAQRKLLVKFVRKSFVKLNLTNPQQTT